MLIIAKGLRLQQQRLQHSADLAQMASEFLAQWRVANIRRKLPMYLGLPVDSAAHLQQYWDDRASKSHRAFHSLNRIGCLSQWSRAQHPSLCIPNLLPADIHIWTRYASHPKAKLSQYDSSQATLKHALGLSKYARSSALIEALKIKTTSFFIL